MFRGTASRVTVFNPHPPSMKPAGLGKVVSLLMWAIVVLFGFAIQSIRVTSTVQ